MASRAAAPSSRKDSGRAAPRGAGERSVGAGERSARGAGEAGDKRPEKSTAVASRLIAAGLGVKAPRRTEEQREYDRAIRAQEVKRREREREEERRKAEESERAKKAIWDD